MVAVFSDGTEIIVCELDEEGQAITNGYFTAGDDGDGRNRDDYDYALVEAPVRVVRGSLRVEPEKTVVGRA